MAIYYDIIKTIKQTETGDRHNVPAAGNKPVGGLAS